MEKEYLEKKIKNDLINKDFKDWCKESVDLLVSIFQFEKCNSFFTINLLLLKDYISWIKKNNIETNENVYTVDTLTKLYNTISQNIQNNKYTNYDEILNGIPSSESLEENDIDCESHKEEKDIPFCKYGFNTCSENDNKNETKTCCEGVWNSFSSFFDVNNCFNTAIIIVVIIYAVIKYIGSYLFFEKVHEQKKQIFELKIPIPENIANHPLLKTVLGGLFEGNNPLSAFQNLNCPFQL